MGEFLSHEHTFMHFRSEFYQPVLSDRQNADQWEKNGALTAEQRANARWKKMLDEYVEPSFDKDIDAALIKPEG